MIQLCDVYKRLTVDLRVYTLTENERMGKHIYANGNQKWAGVTIPKSEKIIDRKSKTVKETKKDII